MAFKSREQMESERLPQERGERVYDNRWKTSINIRSGESLLVRFPTNGYSVEMPFVYRRHSHAEVQVNGNATFNTICLKPNYCPLCELALAARNTKKIGDANATKYIKGASDRGVFRALSARMMLLKQEGDKIKKIPYIHNRDDIPCIQQGKNLVPATEEDKARLMLGYVGFEYEGIKALDLSYTEIKPQVQAVLSLAEKLGGHCACGSKVQAGLERRPAKIARAADGSLICEANCGNPRTIDLDDCFVRVTVAGQDTAKDFEFELRDPSDLPEELVALMYNEDGSLKDVDWKTFEGNIDLQAQVIRGLSAGLRQYGINAEAYLQTNTAPSSSIAPPTAPRAPGSLPMFGAAPDMRGPLPATPPRPPAMNFGSNSAMAGLGGTTGLPSTTISPGAAPLATGVSTAPKAVAVKIPGLKIGG
jgi:hypothetical protein